MVDVVDHDTRGRMMAGIRGKNTKPELVVRKALFAAGYRFRLHRRDLPGVPDIVMPGRMVVVFVHGCFWHRHANCGMATAPATNIDFWRSKLDGNVVRDSRVISELRAAGWRVLTVWECATRGKAARELGDSLSEWVAGSNLSDEIPKKANMLHEATG